jgi:Mn-dependent DtxR family transcriptional regulator
MAALSIDNLFDAAVRIQIEERSFTVTYTDSGIRIKFPTTRRLAEFLNVPHYYILPFFATMEEEDLVTRAERVGITTTAKGTRKLIDLIGSRYRTEAEKILGPAILSELVRSS